MKTTIAILCCVLVTGGVLVAKEAARTYHDESFLQDYSERVPLASELHGAQLRKVRADRNGRVLVLSDKGLLQVHEGRLKPDRLHRPLADMRIRDMEVHEGQFVFLTDKHVLSNAWAGRFLASHKMRAAERLAMGTAFDFLVAGSERVACFRGPDAVRELSTEGGVRQAVFDPVRKQFLVLTETALWRVTSAGEQAAVFRHGQMNCLALTDEDSWIGTSNGYLRLDRRSFEQRSDIETKVPCTEILCIRPIGDKTWFGTPRGAFAMNRDGTIDYYASNRWLVDDAVIDIAPGPDGSVLILSKTGLSIIHFEPMTLAGK
ncbi:MAG TPA: hypothetical protein PLO68_05040, partial [Sedimentisphaerales bacterium]|nr:hypothetical protein [Sedimentisphaerales bacterium]